MLENVRIFSAGKTVIAAEPSYFVEEDIDGIQIPRYLIQVRNFPDWYILCRFKFTRYATD
jgi:hypothetical protein